MQVMLAGRAYQSGTFMLLPRERSFSSKISDQLDRDCEPANNFGAPWKVRSWALSGRRLVFSRIRRWGSECLLPAQPVDAIQVRKRAGLIGW